MQRYVVLGINHKFAPLEVRERVAYPERRVPSALRDFRDRAGSDECVLLSTCNRVEIYAFTTAEDARARLLGVLAADHNLKPDYLDRYCYSHRGIDAVKHLLRVSGGLDSLVLGETQILNQVKKAYLMAQSEGATGKALNSLFHRAFGVAKRLHTETGISEGQLSVSSVAVGFIRRVCEDLGSKTALLIGAGEVGELTLSYLRENGIGRVLVLSRTLDRAKELAQRFQGDAVPFELLEDYLPAADIVISQTAATGTILDRAAFARSQKRRGYQPVFALDLAVPRDIAADAAEVDGVYLYNVDDLERVVAEHAMARSKELSRCQVILDEEASKFLAAFQAMGVGPMISELRERAETLKKQELERLLAKLAALDPAQRDEIASFADRLLNKLLHPQIQAIRESSAAGTQELLMLAKVLGLEGDAGEPPGDAP
ncbi:MAG: glutamyl-tRNA reductase [Planctomycetes bacterium]|nr:glutamyl-tRNA reductase [Planctomycetota bacterium]